MKQEQVVELAKRFQNGAVPACDPKNPKRHGWKCKCSCGWRQKLGGVRNGIHYFNALKELRKIKQMHQEHDLEIEHSYHAAELAHTFAEQTTDQEWLGTQNVWTNFGGGPSIASGNFTAGNKYLIIATAQATYGNVGGVAGLRIEHGSTAFGTSEWEFEPQTDPQTDRWIYAWFTVWTAVASEGLSWESIRRTLNTGAADTMTIVAIEISEDLTEGTDWDYDENLTGNTSLGTTFTTTNNASLTFTPNGTDQYWFMCGARVDPGAANKQMETSMFKDGSVWPTNNLHSQEGEDTTDEKQMHYIAFSEVPSNASHTYTSRSRVDGTGGSTGDRLDARMFWLRLNALRNFAVNADDANFVVGVSQAVWQTIETVSIDPDVTGDVFITCSMKFYHPSSQVSSKFIRQQVANVDQPAGQTSGGTGTYDFGSQWDNDDRFNFCLFTVESLTNNTAIDLDGDSSSTVGTWQTETRLVLAFTMELPAAAGTTHSQSAQH
jgi:hypothetical protein